VRVLRIAWLGTRTDRFEETTAFFRDVLGLPLVRRRTGFAALGLPSGERDLVEVFGPDAPRTDFEAQHYLAGPVAGFLVDDLEGARAELAAAGAELPDQITWLKSRPGHGWFHFRAPDGNLYQMLQDRDHGAVEEA
jgi:catechol 2,3-dioxygenase-like lactoylglutathione lyase family enzyme